MDADEAKRLVLRHRERQKINGSWLATQIGEKDRQKVHHWLNGTHEPADASVWIRMAAALGILNPAQSELAETAREFALEVLVRSDDPQLRLLAAELLRKL